jgi:hypothetical protein
VLVGIHKPGRNETPSEFDDSRPVIGRKAGRDCGDHPLGIDEDVERLWSACIGAKSEATPEQ